MIMKRIETLALIFVFAAVIAISIEGCAITNKKASQYGYGEDCTHCHGEKLEGNKNIKLQCGECHDLVPVSAENIKSESIRGIVLSDPHVHKAKNMFSNTPSCFLCHRQTDF